MSDLRARQGSYEPWRPIEEKSHNQTVFTEIPRVYKAILSKSLLLSIAVMIFVMASYQFFEQVAKTSAAKDDYIAKLENEIEEKQRRIETLMESIYYKEIEEKQRRIGTLMKSIYYKEKENVELHQKNVSLESKKRELSEKPQKNDQMRAAKEKENKLDKEIEHLIDTIRW